MSFATGLHRGKTVPSVGSALSQHFPCFLVEFSQLKGKAPKA